LLDLCERNVLPSRTGGVFLHTGRMPAMFSHANALVIADSATA
jgi:hypothetical protein